MFDHAIQFTSLFYTKIFNISKILQELCGLPLSQFVARLLIFDKRPHTTTNRPFLLFICQSPLDKVFYIVDKIIWQN